MPEHFVDRVAEILTRYNMWPPGAQVGVAVSAGADSVVLLHLLHRLRPRFAASLSVLHVNHQLRGSESDADESFVRELAEALGYPALVTLLPPAEGNTEEQSREARRRFFSEMRQEHRLACIALGHTRSDQAETVLFRVLRGTGTSGLAAMRYVSRSGIVRPLLECSREEVRAWAHTEGIRWRDDTTNDEPRFTRNRLRLITIPELRREYNPNLEATLAGMARVAQDEEDYWEAACATIAGQLPRRTKFGLEIPVATLREMHPALRRRVVRALVIRLKGDLRSIDAKHIEAVLTICRASAGHDRVLIPGVDALRSFHTLLLSHPGSLARNERAYEVTIAPGEEKELPSRAGFVSLNRVPFDSTFCANFKGTPNFPTETVELDEDALVGSAPQRSICIRNWQPGDEILLPGRQRPEKLKALFQDHQVLLWQRRHWPVLVAGDKIAWVRQFGCAAGFQGLPSSRGVLRLSYNDVEECS